MMFNVQLRNWRRREQGFGEIFSTFFILPFVIAIIFLLLEVGMNWRYRMEVDDIVHDTMRAVAADGTAGVPPPWSVLYPTGTANRNCLADGVPVPCRNGYMGATWSTVGRDRLQALCGSGNIRCKPGRLATMVCTPTEVNAPPGAVALVGPNPGVPVKCTGTLPYRNLVSFTVGDRMFNLGFGGFWANDISYTAQGYTMTGSGE